MIFDSHVFEMSSYLLDMKPEIFSLERCHFGFMAYDALGLSDSSFSLQLGDSNL
jgi:hypothetical protein